VISSVFRLFARNFLVDAEVNELISEDVQFAPSIMNVHHFQAPASATVLANLSCQARISTEWQSTVTSMSCCTSRGDISAIVRCSKDRPCCC
jgi:hypothetical protein